MNSDTYSAICQSPEQAREVSLNAYRHAQAMLANGEEVLISAGPALAPIGIQQRRFLHGVVLKQISEKACVGDKRERYTLEVWKEFFRQRFLGFEWEMRKLPGQKRATPHKVWVSTETLGQRAYAKFTNEIIDHAVVELGVEFEFTHEETEFIRGKHG